MQSNLSTVLPFLSARLGVSLAEMYEVRASIALNAFDAHAVQFLTELDAARAEDMTCAEAVAWPAICEVAAKVGLRGG